METEQDTKHRILSLMRDRMLQIGYSKVTLDELADELGISKKTLYKHFSNKDDLAMQAVRFNFFEINTELTGIYVSSLSFIDKLHGMMQLFRQRIGKVSPLAVQDLRKHAPQIWQEIEALRREHVLVKFENMVLHAREEGMLRSDIDERILVKVLLASVEAIANPESQNQLGLPMHEIIHSIFHILFEGALTEEARTKLQGFCVRTADKAGMQSSLGETH